MSHLRIAVVLFTVSMLSDALCPLCPMGSDSPVTPPTGSLEWFQRARDRMNLRMPGSTPFHLRATFHAYPGDEVLDKSETHQICTGDGTYDETWMAPHRWRREVSLDQYRAVEIESDNGRKMSASSDYEPSRILMLLTALLDPIPRNFSSREFRHEGASGWTVEPVDLGGSEVIRISKSTDWSIAQFTDAFYLSLHGALLLRNQDGLATTWMNDATFAGKLVPTRISIRSDETELLSADVTVRPMSRIDGGTFNLTTGIASPGMTLRPLQKFELKSIELLGPDPHWEQASNAALAVYGVVDRRGRFREVEVVIGRNLGGERELRRLMSELRKMRWRPPTIDQDPCEYLTPFLFTKVAIKQDL